MTEPSSQNRIARFGLFELDFREAELRRSGVRRKLGGQPLHLLQVMLERPGETITRDELRTRLWPESTFLDYELAVKKCVNRIREALNDSADNPRFVETVRGRGYRFIAPVEWTTRLGAGAGFSVSLGAQRAIEWPVLRDSSEPAVHPIAATRNNNISLAPSQNGSPAQFGHPRARNPNWRPWAVASICAIALVVCVIAIRSRFNPPPVRPKELAADPVVLPLITLPGEQSMPAFSPDGSRIAFLWHRPPPQETGIYAAVVGSQSVLKLAAGASAYSPAWSPDGRELAFLRDDGNKFSIKVIAALGGVEKTIYTGLRAPFSYENYGLSFSPNGKLLAFSDWNTARQEGAIKLLSLEDSSARFLTSPPPGFCDRRPVFSPDGAELTFLRSTGPTEVDELFVASIVSGRVRPIMAESKNIFGPPTWTPSGGEILFSSDRGGLATVWRIPATGGVPQQVPGVGPVARYPSLSRSGTQLAYEHVDERQELWRLDLKDAVHPRAAASLVVSDARTYNLMPQFSPDGRKIAFQTGRSGYSEVWICDRDGSNLVQVTALHGFAGTPRWAPDGRYLAFDYRPHDHSEIYIVEASGGLPHLIASFTDADSVMPSWSRRGQWIYFSSDHAGKVFQIWKIAIASGVAAAPPVQVTQNGGNASFESWDGRQLFYTKYSGPGIWTMPVDGGPETVVWRGPGPDYWSNWVPVRDGIYFLAPNASAPGEIEFLHFNTKRVSHIARLAKPSFFGLSVAPDGRSLVYSQWERFEHNILVLTNFR